MEHNKKVEVCQNCSGFDVKELKGQEGVKVGCIGKCARKHPELNGKVYGFLNGEFVVCDAKQDFFAKIAALGGYVAQTNKSPLVDALLDHEQKWRDEFDALRAIALDSPLTEELKWGQPCYVYEGGNVLILGGFKDYIALSFFKGALLSDPGGMLVRQTKSVQAGRQLRFTDVRQIAEMEPAIRAYMKEAIQLEKTGAKLPEAPQRELEIPDELLSRFGADDALKSAFFALTPGRQRGYALYFSQAKQVKTREARIEKYAGKILDGKGLDD